VTGTGPEGSREGWIGWLNTLPSLGVYCLVRFAPWWIATLAGLLMLWQVRRNAHAQTLPESIHWMTSAAILVATVIVLFGLSASTRADYLLPAVPQASLLAAWWMREFRRETRIERPWLPALFAAVTLATLTVLNLRDFNAPIKGFGDEINDFIGRCAVRIKADPHPVGFWRVGSEHGGLHLQAFLGLSQSEDARVLKSQLTGLRGPMWIIAGRRDAKPHQFPDWLPLRTGSFVVKEVEESRRMPQGRSAFPEQLTLYLLEPGGAE
jgi:hypothetical protein